MHQDDSVLGDVTIGHILRLAMRKNIFT